MVGKGSLAVFEGCSISETGEVTLTKVDVHACTGRQNVYLKILMYTN